jgi:hypothetical protein
MPHKTALARHIRRRDWERVALLLLVAMAEAARRLPPDGIDDLLALLAEAPGEERDDDGGR